MFLKSFKHKSVSLNKGRLISRWGSSLSEILSQVENGSISAETAERMISNNLPPDETLQSFANLDHNRAFRTGFPEAIYAAGKTSHQVAAILDDMSLNVNNLVESGKAAPTASMAILATRVSQQQYDEVAKIKLKHGQLTYNQMARIISVKASKLTSNDRQTIQTPRKKIVVACAGTTDLPVSEEAAVTLEAAGCEVVRVYDAGVAGLHRIIKALPKLRDPDVRCVIVCAGMDGALPSVVGGLVNCPVIAVPTSVGYGAAFGGVSAMLTMMNSCAPGVGVVNIDNGFGAAALAYKCLPP